MSPGASQIELPDPGTILRMEPGDADRLLDRLEADVPSCRGAARLDVPGAREAIVIGDTHGDWRSTVAAARRFLEEPRGRLFVGLGDYVDRAPDDCAQGSVLNALYLLALAGAYPEQVFLLRGNHEMHRAIPVLPHDLPEEIDTLWGPEPDRYQRLVSLLERGPLAASTGNGLYLAHAGFVRNALEGWANRLDRPSEEDLFEILWAECQESRAHRGVPRFNGPDLTEFLRASGCSVFIRGHDPDLNGRWSLGDRCLTIHSSRVFERYGGVLLARADLTVPAHRGSVTLEHLETEGQEFELPGGP